MLVQFSPKDLSPLSCLSDVRLGTHAVEHTAPSGQHLKTKSAQPLATVLSFHPVAGLGGQDVDAKLHSYAAQAEYSDMSVQELRWKHYAAIARSKGAATADAGSTSVARSGGPDGQAGELLGAAPCTVFTLDNDHVGVRLLASLC
jgi:hypothetical protein